MLETTKEVEFVNSCEKLISSKDKKVVRACNRYLNMNVQINNPVFFIYLFLIVKVTIKDFKTFKVFESS